MGTARERVKVGRVVVDYDDRSDVLYVALDEPRAAESETSPDGLLLRYDMATGEPCGVTAIRMALWRNRLPELSERVGHFLRISAGDVLKAVREGLA